MTIMFADGGQNKPASVFPEVKRDRFVQPEELPPMFAALREEQNIYVHGALLVALLTDAHEAKARNRKVSLTMTIDNEMTL